MRVFLTAILALIPAAASAQVTAIDKIARSGIYQEVRQVVTKGQSLCLFWNQGHDPMAVYAPPGGSDMVLSDKKSLTVQPHERLQIINEGSAANPQTGIVIAMTNLDRPVFVKGIEGDFYTMTCEDK